MRFRFKPTFEQRSALRAQLARLLQPAEVLAVLRSNVPADFKPSEILCTPQNVHSDRFVLRVQMRSAYNEERAYALKVYSDDFGEQVWAHSRALAGHHPPDGDGLCLPSAYIPKQRMLVFPWVEGEFFSEIVDERKLSLLPQAAGIAATLHRAPIVPEQPTTAQMIVNETRSRCERLRRRWPVAAPIIEPLMAALQEALARLDPAEPAPVHGDLASGQFLWTGERLVLLDLDMFGYADPAYDVGHFLAQLERRCLSDPSLPEHASRWLACFRDSYLARMPRVSPRNVMFYRGLTLVRKIYTTCREQTGEWPLLALQLAVRARAALREAVSPG